MKTSKKHSLGDDLRKALQRRSSLAIIITAAVLIEATSAIQYWYARKGIREEVKHRSESDLRGKSLEIRNVMTGVEAAVDNMVWMMEQSLQRPDSLYGVCEHLLANTPSIVGVGIGFEADYYPQYGRWFEPYVLRSANGEMSRSQIGSAGHDYLGAEWYCKGMAADSGYWSEPYFDDSGARMMLCTYSRPIRDAAGRVVAVMGADVSLDWLSEVINAKPLYPSSYNLMISREGQLMACPVESLVLRSSIQDAAFRMEDSSVDAFKQRMLEGRQGHTIVTDEEGHKNYVFYAPVEGGTGWSMAVVCNDQEVFSSLRKLAFNLLLLMLVGLVLLAYLIYRMIKGMNDLQEMNTSKASMESELKIASNIQNSMLPKIFPPYPDRKDIDIYGKQTPAKAVGGDLFDFYIRDEKMFLCIGDVSGKGVPASLVMAVTRTLFRVTSGHEAAPDRIMMQINEAITEGNESNMFVTLFVGVLDLPTGRFRYCNAGHDAPLLVGDSVALLPCEANIPVGIMADWKYVAQEALITPQTTVFLYTDGLTEAENAEHELFGSERMEAAARKIVSEDAHDSITFVSRMAVAVEEFVNGAEQSDDLTMLAVQYTKEQHAVRLQRTLTLPNDVNTVPQLSQFVEEVCEELDFNPTATMQMNLAIEEAVVNVMNYAYPAGTEGVVDIEAQANDERLRFKITDNGIPFDPTAKEETDTSLPLEERPIGGLGIFLVRQLMDSINYERIDGKNVLTLRKKLT